MLHDIGFNWNKNFICLPYYTFFDVILIDIFELLLQPCSFIFGLLIH